MHVIQKESLTKILCIASVLPVCCQCVAKVLSVYCQCMTRLLPDLSVCYHCVTSFVPVCVQLIVSRFKTRLTKSGRTLVIHWH